jgi:3-deoxy-7-phosphoheptulonate synthase
MKEEATEEQIRHVIDRLESAGLRHHLSRGEIKTVIGVIGDREAISRVPIQVLPGVEDVIPILKPYKFVSREFRSEDTVINVNGNKIGGPYFSVIAGPCSVENEDQVIQAARAAKRLGAKFIRGGAYKPRTSPYSFQGLGEEGLKMLSEASKETGLPVVSELLDVRNIEAIDRYADIVQIGARNMQNFVLLLEVGRLNKPVLLKRGFGCTIDELLMAAEYIVKGGNGRIILCERGIRTFEKTTRHTLDISAIPVLKLLTHLPVIVDPSHSGGKRELVAPLSYAAAAAGADGIIVEVHPNPEEALCDGPQSLDIDDFDKLMKKLLPIAKLQGKIVD